MDCKYVARVTYSLRGLAHLQLWVAVLFQLGPVGRDERVGREFASNLRPTMAG